LDRVASVVYRVALQEVTVEALLYHWVVVLSEERLHSVVVAVVALVPMEERADPAAALVSITAPELAHGLVVPEPLVKVLTVDLGEMVVVVVVPVKMDHSITVEMVHYLV
jgi:hypothetical protein